MKKKILGLLLCVVCVLNGCANAPERSHTGQSETKNWNSVSDEKATEEEAAYVQPEMKGELTISCFYEPEFLPIATQRFMERYPDVKVTIHEYDGPAGEGSVEAYQTALNTKIMSQNAEDIIFNSFLPVTKYSEMGAFEDLSSYMERTPEFNEENYFMNVLQAAQEEGGEVYLIPYMAKFDVLGFSGALLSGQEEIKAALQNRQTADFAKSMELAKELYNAAEQENVFLIQENEVSYADEMIKAGFERFVNIKEKRVDIDSDDYIRLLEKIKRLSEDGAFDDGGIDFYNTRYYYAATCDYDVQAAYYALVPGAEMSFCMPISDENGKTAIKANGCIALNSGSKNKALAWEFIRFLLSDDIQSLPSVYGLAVNKKGFEAAVARYYHFYAEDPDGAVDAREYETLLKNWMEQMNDCDMVDGTIWTFIEEENGKFFEGKQSAEETAAILQRKIEQYFHE